MFAAPDLNDSNIEQWYVRFYNYLKKIRIPGKIVLIVMGILSTAWFLFRVIPKPSRASYPCVRATTPFMSGFVLYLLSLVSLSYIIKRMKTSFLMVFLLIFLAVVNITSNSSVSLSQEVLPMGPQDGPNKPFGTGRGVKPGTVVWVWNPDATNENCRNKAENNDWYFTQANTNAAVTGKMVSDAVKKLGGSNDLNKAWDALFRQFNKEKTGKKKGYSAGQKVFIKINQGTASWALSKDEQANAYTVSKDFKPGQRRGRFGAATETAPYVVLEILKELINNAGVSQQDIYIGDPISHIFGHNYSVWQAEFPDVKYVDKFSDQFGRTLIKPTEKELLYYSDKKQADKLFDIIEQADYMINVASLKPHGSAGISITSKNHFGSHARRSASHLHYALIAPLWEESPRQAGKASNGGYKKYRVLVDLMGSKYLGQNTLLFVADGLFGGGADETRGPVKYFMSPFNNDWSNSVFVSQDQVALESVCYDFLRTEWNGRNKHDEANNVFEEGPNMPGVDDHLHQAADSKNWPEGIVYDPDNSGKSIGSLGVHEHWNNAAEKLYSGNMGKKNGITLIAIPDTLIGNRN